MPTKMIRQTTFTFGEVDPVVWKRTDVPEYLTAAQSLKNCEVGTTGLFKKRKGTSFLFNATGYAQFNSHMYEFVDKFNNHYVLLTANNHTYVFAAPTEEAQVITERGNNVVTGYGTNVVAHQDEAVLVQDLNTPYATNALDNIDYTQDNDTVIFTNPDYKPIRIFISQYNGLSFPTFAWEYLNIYPYPSYDFNLINYNAFTVSLSVSGSVLTFSFTGLSSDPGFGPYNGTSPWIGGEIIGGGATELDPVGYAIITNVATSGSSPNIVVTFTATVQVAFNTTTPSTQGSQYSIRQPAWSDALGWPAKVLFFQNRLWLGNTQSLNNTVFGSRINSPINFDVGTGKDTDAIVYTIGQTNTGPILWMNGGKQLEIYTQNNEFACPQDQNAALTPATFSVRQQSSYGSSPFLKPITYINDSYYATKTGKALINFHYNGIGLTYASSNISAASSHLVKRPINRALQRGSDTSQDNFIYYLNPDDDTITTFQFANEVKLAALTPATFQAHVELIDIVTVDNDVYILKYYNLTETYIIEKFDDTTRMDGKVTASMGSTGIVTGLSIYNGYTVQVTYQNQDFGQYLVTGGTIQVANPSGIAADVQVGLLYDVDMIPMYPFANAVASPFMKQLTRIYIDYYQSIAFSINGNLVPYQSFPLYNGKALVAQTDTAIITPFSGWNRFDNNGTPIIRITQSSPFDLQVTSIGYQIDSAVI